MRFIEFVFEKSGKPFLINIDIIRIVAECYDDIQVTEISLIAGKYTTEYRVKGSYEEVKKKISAAYSE